MNNRRIVSPRLAFGVSLSCAVLACSTVPSPPVATVSAPAVVVPLRAYVACQSGTIYTYDVAANGHFTPRGSVRAPAAVWMAASDRGGRYLYTADLAANTVSAFTIEPGTGLLTARNSVKVGEVPAYVSLDAEARHLMVANYGAGTVTVLNISGDGALGTVVAVYPTGKNTHSVLTDPTGRFVLAANLGSDSISQFLFDSAHGTLTPNAVPTAAAPAASGPRHIAFDPAGRFAYVVNEVQSTVSTYAFDPATGTLASRQVLPTIPADFDRAKNTGSDIHVHPSGRFVYASNRGHDSLAIYSVDAAAGTLTLVGYQATGGAKPQVFSLDSRGDILLAANRGSSMVRSFLVDAKTGTLSAQDSVTVDSSPQWVGFVPPRQP